MGNWGVLGVVLGVFVSAQAMASAIPMAAPEQGAWNNANNPGTWDAQYDYELDRLPLSGKSEGHQPWSDTYWPSRQAGIAARWNWPGQRGFDYKTFSENQVRAMSQDQLARLSPAEKYDIYMGRYDYPTVSRIRGQTSRFAQFWAGICHGWSPAAVNHAEPAPVTVVGAGGVTVPFGSDDIKALLDQYYADNAKPSAFLGEKCDSGEGGNIFNRMASPFMNGPSCDDVNAGALHVILTNELGIKHRAFVADVDRWRQVWNQPVYGFQSRLTGSRSPQRDAAAGTVREVLVHTDMFYADELDQPNWNPVVGTSAFKEGIEHYDYSLELDAAGRIIGGQWITSARPDFLWNTLKLEFTGYMAGLNELYRPAGK